MKHDGTFILVSKITLVNLTFISQRHSPSHSPQLILFRANMLMIYAVLRQLMLNLDGNGNKSKKSKPKTVAMKVTTTSMERSNVAGLCWED